MKQILKRIDAAFAIILGIIFSFLLIAFAWISLKPQEVSTSLLAFLNKNDLLSGYQLSADSVYLEGGGVRNPLSLTFKKLQVRDSKDQPVINLPRIQLGAGSLILADKSLTLRRDHLGNFVLLSEGQEIILPTTIDDGSDNQKTSILPFWLRKVVIMNGALAFEDELSGKSYQIPDLDIAIREEVLNSHLSANLMIPKLLVDGQEMTIKGQMGYAKLTHSLTFDLHLVNMKLSQFAPIDRRLDALKDLWMPISGTVKGKFRLKEEALQESLISYLNIDLKSPEFADLHINGKISGRMQTPAMRLSVKTGQFDLPFLKENWPKGIGEDALRWVKRSLVSAKVSHAEAKINLSKTSYQAKRLFNKDEIDAVLHIEDAVLKFVHGFPNLQKMQGRVHFEGQGLRGMVDHVLMLSGTKLRRGEGLPKASVKIPDLAKQNIDIFVEVPFQSPLQDVKRFMEATPYKLTEHSPIDLASLKGNLSGTLNMHVIDEISPKEDQASFTLDSNLSSVSLLDESKDFDLNQFNALMKADNESVTIDGKGRWGRYDFALDTKLSAKSQMVDYKGYLPVSLIALGAGEVEPYLSGGITDVQIKRGKSGRLSFKGDTSPLRYRYPDYGILKREAVPGKIEFSAIRKGNQLKIDELDIQDNEINAKNAALEIDLDEGELLAASVDSLIFKGSKVSGNYSYSDNAGYKIGLRGETLNLEPFLQDEEAEDSSESIAEMLDLPKLQLNAQISALRLASDRYLSNLNAAIDCKQAYCQFADISFSAGDVPFRAQLTKEAGQRQLTASTPNLGYLLKTLDLSKQITRGKLSVNAVFQDEQHNRPLTGRAVLEDFNAKQIPLLTRLLTVATLTGVLDMLSGGGLSFQKLVVPFSYKDDHLYIQKAKAVGPSIGLTANGHLDLAEEKIDLQGAVIPAKLVDTALSGIPLIGNIYDAITGGEGLLAVDYKMQKELEKPEISVNPLSALTPGILRNFFDIFEKPVPESIATPTKKAEENLKAVERAIQKMEEQNSDQ